MNPVKVAVCVLATTAVQHAILNSDTYNHSKIFSTDNNWEMDLFQVRTMDLFQVRTFIREACRVDSILKSQKCD